jgi:haloalkane dehalogenase
VTEHTENLRRLLNALAIERYSLIVHDSGGRIALPLAIESPNRLESLVVLNSWFWSMSIEPSFARAKRLAGSGLMRFLYLHANFSARVMVKASWGSHSPLNSTAHRHFTALFPDRISRLGTWALDNQIRIDQLRMDQEPSSNDIRNDNWFVRN